VAEKLYDFSYRLSYLNSGDTGTRDTPSSPNVKPESHAKKLVPGSRDFH